MDFTSWTKEISGGVTMKSRDLHRRYPRRVGNGKEDA